MSFSHTPDTPDFLSPEIPQQDTWFAKIQFGNKKVFVIPTTGVNHAELMADPFIVGITEALIEATSMGLPLLIVAKESASVKQVLHQAINLMKDISGKVDVRHLNFQAANSVEAWEEEVGDYTQLNGRERGFRSIRKGGLMPAEDDPILSQVSAYLSRAEEQRKDIKRMDNTNRQVIILEDPALQSVKSNSVTIAHSMIADPGSMDSHVLEATYKQATVDKRATYVILLHPETAENLYIQQVGDKKNSLSIPAFPSITPKITTASEPTSIQVTQSKATPQSGSERRRETPHHLALLTIDRLRTTIDHNKKLPASMKEALYTFIDQLLPAIDSYFSQPLSLASFSDSDPLGEVLQSLTLPKESKKFIFDLLGSRKLDTDQILALTKEYVNGLLGGVLLSLDTVNTKKYLVPIDEVYRNHLGRIMGILGKNEDAVRLLDGHTPQDLQLLLQIREEDPIKFLNSIAQKPSLLSTDALRHFAATARKEWHNYRFLDKRGTHVADELQELERAKRLTEIPEFLVDMLVVFLASHGHTAEDLDKNRLEMLGIIREMSSSKTFMQMLKDQKEYMERVAKRQSIVPSEAQVEIPEHAKETYGVLNAYINLISRTTPLLNLLYEGSADHAPLLRDAQKWDAWSMIEPRIKASEVFRKLSADAGSVLLANYKAQMRLIGTFFYSLYRDFSEDAKRTKAELQSDKDDILQNSQHIINYLVEPYHVERLVQHHDLPHTYAFFRDFFIEAFEVWQYQIDEGDRDTSALERRRDFEKKYVHHTHMQPLFTPPNRYLQN